MRPPRARQTKILAIWFVSLLLALAGPAAASPAAPGPDQPARLMLVPLISGYPAGSELPLLMLLALHPGQELAPEAPGAPGLGLGLRADSGLELVEVEAAPGRAGEDGGLRVMIRGRLKVDPGLEPGPRMVKGVLSLPLAGGLRQMEFVLPLTILAAEERPQVLSAEMAQRLGVAADGAVAAPAPGRPAVGASPAAAAPQATAPPTAPAGGDPYGGRSLGWILLFVFAGGLALNLTPCVYPLIPITVGYFGGRAGGRRAALLGSVLAYWAGMAAMYSTLGAFVALSGGMLGEALTHPAVTLFIVAVLLALALSMFGLWEIRLPAALTRLGASNRGGLAGAFAMGLTVGILAAPCVGPFVLGLMGHVAGVGRVDYGLMVFFTLSAGLGAPLAVLAFFSGSLTRLPGAGEWMIWVRKLFGVVLVLMAVYTAEPLLGAAALRWLLALAGAAGGLYLAFWEKSGKGGFIVLKWLVGLALVVAAGLFWWFTAPPEKAPGHLEWTPFSGQVLAKAASEGRPVIVDFSAAWCAPCKQMDAETFSDPRVQAAMAPFLPVKVDATSDPGPEARTLMRQWRVRGVPTIAFLDKKGQIIPELTVVGFMGPEDFINRVKMALARMEEAK
ncbi:MAG: protein-disulfide reductase DsbD family protein [Thermodesulfobacteriota bacterium]